MSVRFLLQYNETPSHALTMCEPWTRWLVEVESPSGRGHAIGGEVELRKTTGQFNIITAIEIKQVKADPTKAQRYLDGNAWWLHRPPFGAERLPVKLTAHKFEGSLVSVDGWNVAALNLERPFLNGSALFKSIGPLSAYLNELTFCSTQVPDLSPFRHLEILSVHGSRKLRDLSGLQGCRYLRVLVISDTEVEDFSALAGVLSLEELDCSGTGVTTLAPLATCYNLKKLICVSCPSLQDPSGLAGAPSLETIQASGRKRKRQR